MLNYLQCLPFLLIPHPPTMDMNLSHFRQGGSLEAILEKNKHKVEKISVNSLDSTFQVEYIASLRSNSYFPLMKMRLAQPTGTSYSWIQIVRSDNDRYSFFVDGGIHYPLYSCSQNFYNAPHFGYTLRKKPVSYWLAHTYCVIADENKNILHCFGGIRWGFTFRHSFSWRPELIKPEALTLERWTKDYTDYLGYLEMYPTNNHFRSPYHSPHSRGRV